MAAATAANVNGLSGDSAAAAAAASSTSVAPTSPSGSNGGDSNGNGAASMKRKRDASNDGDEVMADAGAATASPATAVDQVKAAASASASPALSSKSIIKGKTEVASNGKNATPGPATSTTAGNQDEKRLVRDYFDVLQTYVEVLPSLDIILPPCSSAPAY